MKLSLIKSTINYKNSGGKKLPEDDVLASLIYEAMYYVAGRCVPSELVKSYSDYKERVLRPIENGNFIAIPEYPDFTKPERHLLIDEDLTYAVINYTMFLITQNAMFKQVADEIINEHISKEGIENGTN